MAKIELFWDFKFEGPSNSFQHNEGDLHKYNVGDRVSSFRVHSGYWKLFQHLDWQGHAWGPFGPGDYPDVRALDIPDDFISSIELVSH